MKIKVVTDYEIKYFDCNEPVQSPVYGYVDVERDKMIKGIKRDKLRELRLRKEEIELLLLRAIGKPLLVEMYREDLVEVDRQIRKFKGIKKSGKDGQPYIEASDVRHNYTAQMLMERYGIPVNRGGMTQCICPGHDDKTPSMKVYEYNVHCFGCQKTLDTFGIVQTLEPCDFKTAIRLLAN